MSLQIALKEIPHKEPFLCFHLGQAIALALPDRRAITFYLKSRIIDERSLLSN